MRWRLAFWQVLAALAYLASGWLILRLATVEANITVVWPPTGIAIAVLVVGGWCWWPGVARSGPGSRGGTQGELARSIWAVVKRADS